MERVWDRFLTEQDKAHLAAQSPRPPYGFGENPALISVDNYRGGIGDIRLPLLESIKTWPSSTGEAGWDALENVAVLLKSARAAEIPIVHITGLSETDSGMPGWDRRWHGVSDDDAKRAD